MKEVNPKNSGIQNPNLLKKYFKLDSAKYLFLCGIAVAAVSVFYPDLGLAADQTKTLDVLARPHTEMVKMYESWGAMTLGGLAILMALISSFNRFNLPALLGAIALGVIAGYLPEIAKALTSLGK